jgi:Arc/MetJ-type ribon-helix-helix transcriptional regulator
MIGPIVRWSAQGEPMSRRKGGRAPSTRFTVSLPDPLMRVLDRLRTDRRYGNRSEFVRDLLRAELVKEEWDDQEGETVGVLVLVYDHDTRALADKLTDIQHESRGHSPPGPGPRDPPRGQSPALHQGRALRTARAGHRQASDVAATGRFVDGPRRPVGS